MNRRAFLEAIGLGTVAATTVGLLVAGTRPGYVEGLKVEQKSEAWLFANDGKMRIRVFMNPYKPPQQVIVTVKHCYYDQGHRVFNIYRLDCSGCIGPFPIADFGPTISVKLKASRNVQEIKLQAIHHKCYEQPRCWDCYVRAHRYDHLKG